MTRKVYRTAQGKMVDLGRLQLQHESIRAVGNMKVNARGDMIDSLNRPIETRKQQVNRTYNRQTNNSSPAVHTGKPKKAVAAEIPKPPEDFQDDFDKTLMSSGASEEKDSAAGGLAAAIARARQVKQEPLKTARETAQHQAGVQKI